MAVVSAGTSSQSHIGGVPPAHPQHQLTVESGLKPVRGIKGRKSLLPSPSGGGKRSPGRLHLLLPGHGPLAQMGQVLRSVPGRLAPSEVVSGFSYVAGQGGAKPQALRPFPRPGPEHMRGNPEAQRLRERGVL